MNIFLKLYNLFYIGKILQFIDITMTLKLKDNLSAGGGLQGGVMSNEINGKELAKEIKNNIKSKILSIKNTNTAIRKPCLAVVLIGDDPASKIYVNNKQKACNECLIDSVSIIKPADITQSELEDIVINLNKDRNVDGILVQLPLPNHLDKDKIINLIDKNKDVDGFCNYNIGDIFNLSDVNSILFESLLPCTPKGCIYSILSCFKNKTNTNDKILNGYNVCVVGASNIVGRPVANICISLGATVSVCNSKTKDLSFYTKNADILIVAVGKAKLITKEMVKQNAIVIDVGINRTDNGICGDVDFESVKNQASHITPVPGGIGPLTIAFLMQNTLYSYLKSFIR